MSDRNPSLQSSPATEDFLSEVQKISSLIRLFQTRVLSKYSELTVTDWRVFEALMQHDTLTAATLTRDYDIEKAQLSRRLNAMVKAGYVERQKSPHDKRVAVIKLSQEGRALFLQISPQMDVLSKLLRDHMQPKDAEDLARICGALEPLIRGKIG
ncbi:MAG: MarR family transcriptional regulator [Pseudomonadota bacterium]